jgi:hypothetical protein
MYDVRLAQTLTIEIGGEALGVFLPVYCPTAGTTLYAQLRDVAAGVAGPGPTLLAEGRLYGPTQPWYLQRNFIYIPFSAPAKAPYGSQLSLMVAAKGGECYFALAPAGNGYAAGDGYYRNVSTGGTWFPLAGGSPGEDLPFQLQLRP